MHDGGYPLGNDDFRASFQITGQPFADAGLCGSVHRAGGIVQDQDLRMLQERPGNAETLFLPAGNIDAALAQFCVIPLRQAVDEFVGAGDPACLPDFLLGGVLLAPAQVVQNGSRKQRVLLKDHGDRVPQRNEGVVVDGMAVNTERAGSNVIKPRDQLDQRTLGRTCSAEDAHRLSGLNGEGNVGEDIFLRLRAVFKINMIKGYGAFFNLQILRVFLCNVDLLVQNLRNAGAGGQRTGQHQEYIGDHHERIQDLEDVAEKAGQLPHLHFLYEDQVAADPEDEQDGRIHDKLHGRHVEGGEAEGCLGGGPEFRVGFVEFICFVIAADVGFDDPDRGQVFLDDPVQKIDGALHPGVKRTYILYDQKQHDAEHRGGHAEDKRQLPVHDEGHGDGSKHHDRGSASGAETGGDRVLDRRDVAGQPGHERRGPEVVNIGERKALELLIFRFPQLRSQALAADGRIAGAAHAEKQRDHSADNHQSPPLKDYRAVSRRDSHVDDVRHDHGNDQLKDTFQDDAAYGQYCVFFVRLNIGKKSSKHWDSPPSVFRITGSPCIPLF